MSEETKKKISDGNKNTSKYTLKKMSEAQSNRSVETRKKMSEATKNRPQISDTTRKKMSESGKNRPQISDTTRKKMSGKILSTETRKKISESGKGKIISKVTRKKISKALTGHKVSKVTRKKISEANIGKISKMKGLPGRKIPLEERKRVSEKFSTPSMKQMFRERLRKTRHNQQKPNKKELKIKKILTDAKIDFQMFKQVDYYVEKESRKHEADFFIPPNKIIEHNGTYAHADPRKYSTDDKIYDDIAGDIWKKEEIMLKQIRKENYKILVIWEIDLLKDIGTTTKKILKFVNLNS